MGLAQTGTGKTAAFALPMLNHLIKQTGSPSSTRRGSRPTRNKVRALIIAPTRELAEQINDNIIELARGRSLRA